jgi:sigma-B regulation protein RsbU (phosphoserine phosphatase)
VTLRTLLILSYVVVILLLAGGLGVMLDLALSRMARENLAISESAMEELTDLSNQLVRSQLINYAESNATQRLELVGSQLQQLLAARQMTPADLAASPEARTVVSRRIHTIQGDPVGRMGLYGPDARPRIRPPELPGLDQAGQDHIAELLGQIDRAGRTVTLSAPRGGNRAGPAWFLAARRLRGLDLYLVAEINPGLYVAPIDQQLQQASRRARNTAASRIMDAGDLSQQQLRIGLILGAGVLTLLAVLFGLRFTTAVLKPLTRLRSAVRQLGAGDFAVHVPESGTLEVRQLARSFNRLGRRLDHYVRDLKQEVAARHRVEEELRIAEQIQQALLPADDLPAATDGKLSLRGQNVPSEQVGGDLYDYFRLDDGRIAAIIGDVAGKGIPAALFMSMTHTLLRVVCRAYADPGRALGEANRLLCEQNEAGLHVTMYVVYYDPTDGSCRTANAGHLPPLLLGPDGAVVELADQAHGTVLGLVDQAEYPTCRLELQPGQGLVLLTDGIPEAGVSTGKMLGTDRVIQLCRQWASLPVEQICSRLIDAAVEYQEGNLRDDLTVLALRRGAD